MPDLQKTVEFLEELEGFSPTVYKDSVGKDTIGIGTLWIRGMPETVTKAQAELMCSADCQKRIQQISNFVRVELNDNQWCAVVSFCYNVGINAFKNSTLLKDLNNSDFSAAGDQFLVWDKGTVNGQKVVIQGLYNRRVKERSKFLEAI